MNFNELTSEQKEQVAVFMGVYRPLMGDVSRMLTKMQKMLDSWDANVLWIVNQLADSAHIPNGTDLAGAQEMTAEQLKDSVADFSLAVQTFNTDPKRQRYIQAAGLPNTLG